MILDWKGCGPRANQYRVLDAGTGEDLAKERIFFADDEAGYYLRHRLNDQGQRYIWDSRTRLPVTDATPPAFREGAWERVDRAITIAKKEVILTIGGVRIPVTNLRLVSVRKIEEPESPDEKAEMERFFFGHR